MNFKDLCFSEGESDVEVESKEEYGFEVCDVVKIFIIMLEEFCCDKGSFVVKVYFFVVEWFWDSGWLDKVLFDLCYSFVIILFSICGLGVEECRSLVCEGIVLVKVEEVCVFLGKEVFVLFMV